MLSFAFLLLLELPAQPLGGMLWILGDIDLIGILVEKSDSFITLELKFLKICLASLLSIAWESKTVISNL